MNYIQLSPCCVGTHGIDSGAVGMGNRRKLLDSGRKRQALHVFLVGITLVLVESCNRTAPFEIALIPRTAGMGLWEPEHRGADAAATKIGARIYWNAPTREDDVEGQIALIDQVVNRGYQGLVIAPDQALALITPVRRALARKIPTVIVSSPLPIPPGDKLFYVLNDDEAAGRMAAQRVAQLLHGRGFVIVLGVNPDIAGIMIRARSFELYLTENYRNVRIYSKRSEEHTSELQSHSDLVCRLLLEKKNSKSIYESVS